MITLTCYMMSNSCDHRPKINIAEMFSKHYAYYSAEPFVNIELWCVSLKIYSNTSVNTLPRGPTEG